MGCPETTNANGIGVDSGGSLAWMCTDTNHTTEVFKIDRKGFSMLASYPGPIAQPSPTFRMRGSTVGSNAYHATLDP
jgi:hypothetical protein